ncbi:hypothetical protein [Paludibacterium purpuratum]|uniref:EspA-like secreted protein n=1 Tax=Paludibacterium purpuratum TaxID=1144873 RepID=A0A4R7B140_9NEIS|nr:hypothetical protein [Paludibacterium purpuratum]TDR76642.1 EspA-like secreted protein [Paludibacterium purpuratum]
MTDPLTIRSAAPAPLAAASEVEKTASPSLMERLGNIVKTVMDNFISPLIEFGKQVLKGLTTLLAVKLPMAEAKPHAERIAAQLGKMDKADAQSDLPTDTRAYLTKSGIKINGDMTIDSYLKSIGHPDGKNLDEAQLKNIQAALAKAAEGDQGGKILAGAQYFLDVASTLRDLSKILLLAPNGLPALKA